MSTGAQRFAMPIVLLLYLLFAVGLLVVERGVRRRLSRRYGVTVVHGTAGHWRTQEPVPPQLGRRVFLIGVAYWVLGMSLAIIWTVGCAVLLNLLLANPN